MFFFSLNILNFINCLCIYILHAYHIRHSIVFSNKTLLKLIVFATDFRIKILTQKQLAFLLFCWSTRIKLAAPIIVLMLIL